MECIKLPLKTNDFIHSSYFTPIHVDPTNMYEEEIREP